MGKEQDLVQAIRTNDVESFKKIITKFKLKSKKAHKKSSLHIVDHDGFIPLHHAALSGSGEIVMGLLEFTTDVNAKDKKGMTPLHLAAWAGKVEPALLLLDAGAQTNLCARSGATPLHLASEHGNYGVVERLVDHDCDPAVVNNQGETALDLACRFGHLEVVRILLNNSRGKCEKLLNPKEFQEKASPLHMAAKAGHFDVVKLLVEAGTDINQRGPTGTCLHEAALYGKTDVVKYLIEAGIDVNLKNREGHTALDMVTQFTKSGALSEIKHMLREASVEVVYAKAIKDYCNIKDDSCLTLRMGDIVLVLDRRKDGMWKGCVRDDQKERIGFFPSSVVKVLRPPSRNSVKRSSSSSCEASKVSTVGTVSNTFEIVTVTPPNQPVASKSRAPRMSSFRKKAPNKSSSESDDRSPRAPKNGETRRDADAGSRSQSESNLDDKKKTLNYLDVMVVEKHSNDRTKSGATSGPTPKTEYADVWVTNANDGDKKDIQRTNETQKSVRVNGSYARLGKQVLGKQGTDDNEKLRQELQRQQEERLKRQQKKLEEDNVQKQHAEKQLLEEQKREEECQELPYKQQKILQQVKLNQKQQQQQQQQQQPPEIQFPEQKRSSSETQLSPEQPGPPIAIKSRHYTMSSLVANSQDLPPLPLQKRHSLSGDSPSIPSVTDPILPPKVDKKNRSSFRADRRGTSPPPPPPPPPSGATTPSSASSDVAPNITAIRSPSPTVAPPPKTNEEFPLSDQPIRSPSPSFPPPPPGNLTPELSSPTLNVNQPQDHRSPSPPLPPPPVSLTSPSTSSLGDFPPPPSALMENPPESSDIDTHLPPPPDTLELSPPNPLGNSSTLQPPKTVQSRDGYEDMTRLKRTWTKPEATIDQKGYVMITPVKRPSSPASSPVNVPTCPPPKPLSISSKLYENFIPLKTRNFEVRKLDSVPDEVPTDEGETSPTKLGKPEKPGRHCYVNCEVSGHNHGTKGPTGGANQETTLQIKDDSSEKLIEKSTPGALPVLRVPPVPQVSTDPPSGLTNIRNLEYDELYDWLAQSKLLTYMDNFAASGFDLSAMAGLTADDLSEIEITKTGHRKRLLSEASKLSTQDFSYENNVPSWLKSLGLSRYENHFMDGGFDDMEFLYDLTKEDLEAIGITKVGHQRKLLIAAKRLQQRENDNLATSSNSNSGTDSAQKDASHGRSNDVITVGVTRVFADERVGEYAVPRVSNFAAGKTDVDESSTEVREELAEHILDTHSQGTQRSTEDLNFEGEIIESNKEFIGEYKTLEMNGNSVGEDNVDGVKELAASFQHAIHEETAKAKGKPPPVKPKSYKKGPPPVVAPKPRANGIKSHKINHSPTDVSSRVDFTEVIKEAESLSESGSEQSPPSTLGRDRKSESGVSVGSSLVTTTSGSQGSLNSESDGELHREIKESLHHKRSTETSLEDLTKMAYLTLSQEDLLEQQKREEELEKYQEEQSKTDTLFNDIQGMLENLNSELDDMFK